jgi:hypothetical protein
MSTPSAAELGLAELTALVRDCSVAGVERRVLLLRIDLLPPRLSRPHHLRLAYEALEPLVGADRARRHALSHERVAISWRGEAAERLRQALDGLGHLLQDAPMEAPTMPELARLFDLPKDGAALIAIAASPGHSNPDAESADTVEDTAALPPPLVPLDLAALDAIEARLASANVARFVRRRLICRMGATTLTPAWETRVLSAQDLIDELCPGRNAFAAPWLFRRLTRILDRRMLALLTSPAELREAGPFGLDLNVGGILGPEFQKFDAALPTRLRGQIVLNLHPADVMADVASFRFACAFARGRGHRIMLRTMTPPLLPLLDLAALELDFVELQWSAPLHGFDPAALRAGSARWLLSEADDEAALRWGRAAGIGLFQGQAAQPGVNQAGAGHDGSRLATVRSAA